MKAIFALAILLTAPGATAAEIRQALTLNWTGVVEDVSPQYPRGDVRLLGRLGAPDAPLGGLSSCEGWHAWDGRSGGVCTVTDTAGDAYTFEYSCDRSAGWPPPPSCADGYWSSTQCGQMVVLPTGTTFVCEGTTLVQGGSGKYTVLRGSGRMQQFNVGSPATGYWIVETNYRY